MGYARLSRYANYESRYRWVACQEIIARGSAGRFSLDSSEDEEQRGRYQESESHSATEPCNSNSSWGHEIVSFTENLYSDLNLQKLWPVCSTRVASAYFDTAISRMRAAKGLRVRDSGPGEVPVE